MKIAISSVGPDFNSAVDPRFGRCQYFLIVDGKGKLLKSIPNEGGMAMRGAGISAAQIIVSEGVDTVITGNVGPNAYMVLNQSGIKIFPGAFGMSVKQALDAYKKGKLKEIDVSQGYGFGPGFARGTGMGPGRGMGRGSGMGRGTGLGRGRGRRPNR